MAYQKQIYQDGITEYTEEVFKHIDDGVFGAYPVQLIAISDTAPSTCAKDDKYYNTSSKKIFTATGTNTWGTNGETPIEDTSYWLISENGSYAWNGTDLVSIGGGKAEVVISDEEPEEGKLWVDTAEIPTIAGRDRLVNVSNEVDEDYRVNVLKNTKNLLNTNIKQCSIGPNGEEITTDANIRMTFDYIKVDANKQIIFSCNDTATLIGIAYYDSSKTFISRTTNNTVSSISGTTPNNCTYVRPFITGFNSTISSINQYEMQLELGNTRTTFEEVITPSIYVDNDEIYSKPVVLWQNSSPTSAFAGQQITLSDNIENYSYYEVIFEYSTSYNYSLSTGKINTNLKGLLIAPSSILQRRFISTISGTSMSFLNGQKITTYGGSATDDNTLCVPLQVLGYK